MILGLDELNIYIGIFMKNKPVHDITCMIPIAYASSEITDEPAHPRKIVSALRLNCYHRRNVDEGTFNNLG